MSIGCPNWRKNRKKVAQVLYKLKIFFTERNKIFYQSLQKELTYLMWILRTFPEKNTLATITPFNLAGEFNKNE